jgi:hypothetical protein
MIKNLSSSGVLLDIGHAYLLNWQILQREFGVLKLCEIRFQDTGGPITLPSNFVLRNSIGKIKIHDGIN